jgi:hypothetical protein
MSGMRRTLALLFVTVAAIATPLAITAVWLRETLLVTHRYVAVVAPLSSNAAVDQAIASQVTSALLANAHITNGSGILSLTINGGVRDTTEALVEKFLQTDEFHTLWINANIQAQEQLRAALEGKPSAVVSPNGSVEIDLSNIVLAARSQLGIAGLHIFDKIAPAALHRGIVIARPSTLSKGKQAVRALKAAAIVLPVVAVVFAALALLVARERKRAVFWLGTCVSAACVVGLIAISFGRHFYLADVAGPDVPIAAARAIYDTVLHDLRLYLELAALAGVVAMVAAALAGTSTTARTIRAGTLKAAGGIADGAVGKSATVGWVAENKSTLRTVVIVAGLLLAATATHLTTRYFVEIGVGVLLLLGALEILSRPRRVP